MRLTEQDKKLLQTLRESQYKDDLVDYLERMRDHLCNVRNWKEFSDINAKAMIEAADAIQTLVIDKIKYKNKVKKQNNFE
jgi:hypothetical protein